MIHLFLKNKSNQSDFLSKIIYLKDEQNILQSKSVEKGPQEILPKAINTNKTVEKSASLVKETDELDAELLDIINSCIVENPALLQMTDKNSAISYIAKINDDKPNDSAKPLADNVENNQFKSDFICTTENPSASNLSLILKNLIFNLFLNI